MTAAGGDDQPAEQQAKPEVFPRGTALPKQTPLFWVADKDRYLRQQLIRDIEAITGRRLLVYFTDCETADVAAQILPSDDVYLLELLSDVANEPVDLMLETNGGYTDATEKVVSILQAMAPDLRVVVPRRAKSNGTLVALAAAEIVMGPGSELGPIDPNLVIGPQQAVPAQFVMQTQNVDPVLFQQASYAVAQTRKLATKLLQLGMMKNEAARVAEVVDKLATRDHFHSHGSVIEAAEAKEMGLNVALLKQDTDLWQRFWLLRCMYAFDLRRAGLIKIFEGRQISNSLQASPVA